MNVEGVLTIQMRVFKHTDPDLKTTQAYKMVTIHREVRISEADARKVFKQFKETNAHINPIELVAYLSYDRICL